MGMHCLCYQAFHIKSEEEKKRKTLYYINSIVIITTFKPTK